MNELINWQTFKEQLLTNTGLGLQFKYADNKWVDPSYHITEIKQASIVSVDCGGKMNSWTEIIVQLWEPGQQQQERAMKTEKAASIIDLVERVLPLDPLGTVKIEFGNSQFDTRQMYPGEFIIEGENLVIDLQPDKTQCKAIGRGASCGTVENGEECCTTTKKSDIELANLTEKTACCTPGAEGC